MKKLVLLLVLFASLRTSAQWFEVSATGGAAYYKISAGIKNGVCGISNVAFSVVKAKYMDFGVQFTATTKLTMCNTLSPGVFADLIINPGENKKNIFTIGGHGNYVYYGTVKTPGAFYKDGSIDTLPTKVDNSVSYGLRFGYKRQFSEHIYGYLLTNATYTETSTIHYGTVATNTCAVLTLALMVGIAARF